MGCGEFIRTESRLGHQGYSKGFCDPATESDSSAILSAGKGHRN
jgi:hypothetical protein